MERQQFGGSDPLNLEAIHAIPGVTREDLKP